MKSTAGTIDEAKLRIKYANKDLLQARRSNGLMVTGTKSGNLDINLDGDGFIISNLNTGEIYFKGDRAKATAYLAEQYVFTYVS